LHHSLADGIGALRLTELYMDRMREAPAARPVDLDAVVRDAVAEEEKTDEGNVVAATTRSLGHVWRRQMGVARRAAGEVAMWGADPLRARDAAAGVARTVGQVRTQVGGQSETPGGSPLWKQRSRHRRLETLRLPLEPARAASKALGGTVN